MSDTAAPLVGIVMGSRSDWETMQHAAAKLEALGVPHEIRVVSAHRTPDLLFDYAATARQRGLRAIIAGAANAALFAAALLAHEQPAVGRALDEFRERQTDDVLTHNDPRQ